MSIRYNIFPSLDLLLYVFEGDCAAKQYFDLYHEIHKQDARRHYGMKVLMDLSHGSIELENNSLSVAKQIIVNNRTDGRPRDRVAMLSTSSSLSKLKEAFVLIADDLPLELEVFHNIKDTIDWLGLSDHERQVLEIFKDAHS